MSRPLDLTGMRFGKLTAVAPTQERKGRYLVWQCRCDCGTEVMVSSKNLRNGNTTSCGCEKSRRRSPDLTGKRFGMLTVVGEAERKTGADGRPGARQWLCRCDCGGSVVTTAGQLNAGYRKSCGCLSRPPIKDWVGRQFGDLTVLSYDGKRGGKHFWNCKCRCGNTVSVCQSNLKSGHSVSCGCHASPTRTKHFVEGTCIESIRSRRPFSTNTSGVRGVYPAGNMWAAQITFQGKTRYLGRYKTVEEAAEIRRRAEEVFDDFLEQYDNQARETGTNH